MPLTQIRYFYEVARTGSIREASDRLNVTPSSVSRQVRNLELSIKTPLFERRVRGMTLTAAGELYMNYARSVLTEMELLHTSIEDLKGLRRGHVRIHVVEGIVTETLMGVIARFRTKNPGVSFELNVTVPEAIIATIVSAETDIGITFGDDSNFGVNVALSIKAPLFVIVRPDHALAGKQKISLAEALSYPIAVPDGSFSIRKLIDKCCQKNNLVLTPALVTNSIEALRQFAKSGAGLTMLPIPTVSDDLERSVLTKLQIQDTLLNKSTFDFCVSKHRKLPNAAAEFLRYLETTFKPSRMAT